MANVNYCIKCKKSKEPNQLSMCEDCQKSTSNFIKQAFAIDSDDLSDLGVTSYIRKDTK